MSKKNVRLSKSSIEDSDIFAVSDVLRAGYLGMGENVKQFEVSLKEYLGEPTREVICCSTGTSALHMSLSCMDIGPGDEVLVPSITYVASYQAISATGANPVSCDVKLESGFLDIEDAEKRITAKTKAILPVHYASDASQSLGVYKLANRFGLRVVEDAAHSFGGLYQGKRVGAIGDVVCFSFDGIKNITCGEGGAVVTSDSGLAERLRDCRLLGVEKDSEARYQKTRSWNFDVKYQGFRYHMSNIMAALGSSQLQRSTKLFEKRRALMNIYLEKVQEFDFLRPLELDYSELVPHIFVVRVVNGMRDICREVLREEGFETGIHYFPNHMLTKYCSPYRLPNAEKFASEILSLPLHPEVDVEDIERLFLVLKRI